MPYFLGQNLPDSQNIRSLLPKIYGIGIFRGHQVCDLFGLQPDAKLRDLSPSFLQKMERIIKRELLLEESLKRDLEERKKRQTKIGSYKGLRYKAGLPVRGQRTHSNARTAKKMRMVP